MCSLPEIRSDASPFPSDVVRYVRAHLAERPFGILFTHDHIVLFDAYVERADLYAAAIAATTWPSGCTVRTLVDEHFLAAVALDDIADTVDSNEVMGMLFRLRRDVSHRMDVLDAMREELGVNHTNLVCRFGQPFPAVLGYDPATGLVTLTARWRARPATAEEIEREEAAPGQTLLERVD